jgi:ketosteroid isomerase-like protein
MGMTPSEFMLEYESAGNRRDLDALLAFIADEAIFLFSNQSAHVGKNAIRKAIQSNFETIKAEKYRISGLTWLATSEDLAVCVYEFDWSGEIDGAAVSGSGRGTSVIVRVEDAWRVVHEHLSRGRLQAVSARAPQ